MTTLRSTSWDGDAPAVGDVLLMGEDAAHVVERVAEGPGLGQYRLDVRPARLIRWREA